VKSPDDSPRILRIAATLPPVAGGLEVHARELTLQQAARGHTVILTYGEGEVPLSPAVLDRQIHPSGRFSGGRFKRQAFARAVAKTDFGPARIGVVHAHGDYAVAWAAARVARRLGVPSILTIHGALNERRIHRWLGSRVYPQVGRIIAVSGHIAEQLTEIGVRRENIEVISSGIHFSRFAAASGDRPAIRAELAAAPDDLLIVAVGRLHAVKGFEYLVAAAGELHRKGRRVRVVIAGAGPEEPALRRQASNFANVHLVGEATPDRVADLLAAADLFVLPSVQLSGQAEGTPTSIMEAMASSLPIVATRTGGIPQLLADGTNGVLIEPGSTAALTSAIERLADDPRGRHRMGDGNRVAMRDRDWTVVAGRVLDAYRRAGATL
jgi:glycosyltransferase involved in cell wall biosynthesis